MSKEYLEDSGTENVFCTSCGDYFCGHANDNRRKTFEALRTKVAELEKSLLATAERLVWYEGGFADKWERSWDDALERAKNPRSAGVFRRDVERCQEEGRITLAGIYKDGDSK